MSRAFLMIAVGAIFPAVSLGQALPTLPLTVTSAEQCSAFARQCGDATSTRLGQMKACRSNSESMYGATEYYKRVRTIQACPGPEHTAYVLPECDTPAQALCQAQIHCRNAVKACYEALEQLKASKRVAQRPDITVQNEVVATYARHATSEAGDIAAAQALRALPKSLWATQQKLDIATAWLTAFSPQSEASARLNSMAHLGISAGAPAFKGNALSVALTRTVFDSVFGLHERAMADFKDVWLRDYLEGEAHRAPYLQRRANVGIAISTPLLARALGNESSVGHRASSVSQSTFALADAHAYQQRLEDEREQAEWDRQETLRQEQEALRASQQRAYEQARADRLATENRLRELAAQREAREIERQYERELESERRSSSDSVLGGIARGLVDLEIQRQANKRGEARSESAESGTTPAPNCFGGCWDEVRRVCRAAPTNGSRCTVR